MENDTAAFKEKDNICRMENKDVTSNMFEDNRYNIPIPIVFPQVNEEVTGDESSYSTLPPPTLRRSNTNSYEISRTDNKIEYNGDKIEGGVEEDEEIVSILSRYKPSKSASSQNTEEVTNRLPGAPDTKEKISQGIPKDEDYTDLSDQHAINKDVVEGILCQSLSKLSIDNKDNSSPETSLPQQQSLLEDEEDLEEDISTCGNIYIQDSTNSTPVILDGDVDVKIDMYNNPQYNICQQKALEFENSEIGSYYKIHFCLKPCSSSKCRESTIEKNYSAIQEYITNTYEDVLKYNQVRLCVLPKDHIGACNSSPFSEKKTLVPSRVSSKMETSINSCIYQVPGDTSGNSFFKNRASRLYPIVISSDTKFKMKRESSESKIPKICISLKEHTTPFLMATAYIDWVTYAIHIEGMEENIISPLSEPYLGWKNLLMGQHSSFLQTYFKNRNRKIFDTKSGVRRTICAVKQNILTVSNFADITRDNRINIDQNDIQMGHILPRNNNEYTIRGTNLLMMTREGNRAVGENDYMDDSWILRDISILQNLCNPKMD